MSQFLGAAEPGGLGSGYPEQLPGASSTQAGGGSPSEDTASAQAQPCTKALMTLKPYILGTWMEGTRDEALLEGPGSPGMRDTWEPGSQRGLGHQQPQYQITFQGSCPPRKGQVVRLWSALAAQSLLKGCRLRRRLGVAWDLERFTRPQRPGH